MAVQDAMPDVEAPQEAAQHTLHIQDGTGDTQMTWGTAQPEVDEARSTFARLKGLGYLAYMVDPEDGSKGEVIHEFNPEAHAIIMAPQTVGG